jgi:hypothetical protein
MENLAYNISIPTSPIRHSLKDNLTSDFELSFKKKVFENMKKIDIGGKK